jgi:hypothetical protein
MAWDNIKYIVYGLLVFGIGDLNYEKKLNVQKGYLANKFICALCALCAKHNRYQVIDNKYVNTIKYLLQNINFL